jgi:hypothetical protein
VNDLVAALYAGAVGTALLVLLWPRRWHGMRVLHRGHVQDGTPEETALAVAHLRRRRYWYPPATAMCGGVVAVLLPDGRDATGDIVRAALTGVLLGALLAEIVGCLQERRAHPPRGTAPTLPWTRLVGIGGVATSCGIVAAVTASWMVEPRQSLIAPPPGVVEEAGPNPVGCAVAAALIVLAGWWVVIMASRLPVESTERAHTVLQRRTARTAVGLAAFAAVLFAGRSSFEGWLLVAGMIAWMGYAQVPGDRSVAYRATFLAGRSSRPPSGWPPPTGGFSIGGRSGPHLRRVRPETAPTTIEAVSGRSRRGRDWTGLADSTV